MARRASQMVHALSAKVNKACLRWALFSTDHIPRCEVIAKPRTEQLEMHGVICTL